MSSLGEGGTGKRSLPPVAFPAGFADDVFLMLPCLTVPPYDVRFTSDFSETFIVDSYVAAVMSPNIIIDCDVEEDRALDDLKRAAGAMIADALERPSVVSECNSSTSSSRPLNAETRQLAATLQTDIGNRMYQPPIDLRHLGTLLVGFSNFLSSVSSVSYTVLICIRKEICR